MLTHFQKRIYEHFNRLKKSSGTKVLQLIFVARHFFGVDNRFSRLVDIRDSRSRVLLAPFGGLSRRI
jgi:hypothetical protein